MNKTHELADYLEHFLERLNLVFAYHFCVVEFENDKDLAPDAKGDRTWSLQTIQNACLHTTLIALRDLDDFYMPRNKGTKSDDIRGSDFGFPRDLSFLSSTEREDINKIIAHTTTRGAWTPRKLWDVFQLVTKAHDQGMEFLEWVGRIHSQDFRIMTAAIFGQSKSKAIHKYIADRVRQQNPGNDAPNAGSASGITASKRG